MSAVATQVLKLVAESDVSQLGKAKTELDGVDRAADKSSKGLGNLAKETEHASGGISKMAVAVGTFAGNVATEIAGKVVQGFKSGMSAAMDLQQSVANISTIKPEINTSAVFTSLNEMSRRIPQTSAQLGDSLYDVFSTLDVSSEQGLALVEKFGKGAVGAQTDAKTFGTAVMGVMNAYKLSVDDADHVSDVFFNTIAKGVVTGPELASSLGPVTQAAKAAGVSFDELGGLIAGVTKEGGPAAQNINNLNNFLQKIVTTDAQAALQKLGVQTTNADGSFRKITDVVKDLSVVMADFTEEEKAAAMQEIFPDAQARQGAQTLISQIGFVTDAIESNKNALGISEEAYKKMSETASSQLKILQNVFTSLFVEGAAKVLPLITPIITALAKELPGAVDAATQFFLQAFTKLGLFLTDTFGIQVEGVRTGVGAWKAIFAEVADIVTGRVIPTFQNIAAVAGEVVQQVIARWPLVRDAISDAITAVKPVVERVMADLRAAFEHVVSFVQEKWPAIRETAMGVFDALKDAVQGVQREIVPTLDAIVSIVERVVQEIGERWGMIEAVIKPPIEFAVSYVKAQLDIISNVVQTVMNLVQGDWSGAWENVKNIAGTLWEQIKALVKLQIELIPAILTLGFALIKDAASLGWEAVKTVASEAWDALKTLVREKGDDVVTEVKTLPGKIKDGLGNLSTYLLSAGADLIRGMISGVKSMAQELASAATGVVGDAVDAVKRKLGIESPSRVMADEVGKPMAQGVGVGFEEGINAERAAMQEVAADAGETAAESFLEAWQNRNIANRERAAAAVEPMYEDTRTLAQMAGDGDGAAYLAALQNRLAGQRADREASRPPTDADIMAMSNRANPAIRDFFASRGITLPGSSAPSGGDGVIWTGPETGWMQDALGRWYQITSTALQNAARAADALAGAASTSAAALITTAAAAEAAAEATDIVAAALARASQPAQLGGSTPAPGAPPPGEAWGTSGSAICRHPYDVVIVNGVPVFCFELMGRPDPARQAWDPTYMNPYYKSPAEFLPQTLGVVGALAGGGGSGAGGALQVNLIMDGQAFARAVVPALDRVQGGMIEARLVS